MPDLNPRNLQRHIIPAFAAAKDCLPAYRHEVIPILLFSGAAVALEATGLVFVYFLIRLFSDEPLQLAGPVAHLQPLLESSVTLMLACILLLTAGVRLKYRVIRATNKVAYLAGIHARRHALLRTHALLEHGSPQPQDKNKQRNALSILLKEIPFACGFASGEFLLIGVHVVQASVLLVLLLWLSPLLTVTLLILAVFVFALLGGAFKSVVDTSRERREQVSSHRAEAIEIGSSLFDHEVSAEEYSREMERMLHSGSTNRWLLLRLTQRTQLRAGSLVIEYLYPMAIVAITVLYFYTGNLAPHISGVALYFLLMRQTMGSLNSMGSTLMSFSRFQHPLSIYHSLVSGDRLPDGLFVASQDGGDD